MPLGPQEKEREPTKLSRKGASQLAVFEGGAAPDGRFYPYWDALGGVWTQGLGHTRDVDPNDRSWSLRKAKRIARKDSAPVAKLAQQQCTFPLHQHELDALILIGFNLGPGIFLDNRSLGQAINAANLSAKKRNGRPSKDALRLVADSFKLYNKAGDPPREVAGLTARRKRERHIFLYGYKKRRR